MSRYRITSNNGMFRIEEFRRCGLFLWLRRDWRPVYWIQLIRTWQPLTGLFSRAGAEEASVSVYCECDSLDWAKERLAQLQKNERIQTSPWKAVP